MGYIISAEVEIDGEVLPVYSSVTLNQKFNDHHEFLIRVDYDLIENSSSFSLSNAQKKIGKTALIRLQKNTDSSEVAYEFRGIICEVRLEQAGKSDADLVFKGYSPTILVETGPNLASFYKADLKKIVQKVTKPVSDFDCKVNINNQYQKPITYICQYKESGFHFLNRLSADYSEFFYYDGQDLNFGKPSNTKNIEVAYGEDITSMQLALRLQPMNFNNFAYVSKDDKVLNVDAPSSVNGLGQYASYVLKESNNLFSEPVTQPIRQRVENKSELEGFAKSQKAAMAANLEVLTATSFNPEICIGAVINFKISKLQDLNFIKEDFGEYLVIRIDHFINENGKYYNSFEAIPAASEVIPVTNIIVPIAEPQIATVKDNKDPDNMGRVRAQMLWQEDDNITDWLRVMTPDAGGGKDGAKNRGLVVIPEPGDQVLVCFRYNDPDRPFVLGSLFHGKSGGGGGSGNKVKSLTALSGSVVSLEGDAINIIDAKGNKVILDGAGKININCSDSITLECGGSKISMDSDGNIKITGKDIEIHGSSKAVMKSNAAFTAEGSSAKINGDTIVDIKSATKIEAKAPTTEIKADANLKLEAPVTQINGTATTDIKGGVILLNCG